MILIYNTLLGSLHQFKTKTYLNHTYLPPLINYFFVLKTESSMLQYNKVRSLKYSLLSSLK